MTMETYSSRASSLFTTFTTVLFVVACMNHLTSYFHVSHPTGDIQVRSGSVEFSEFKPYKADQARFNFDLSVDLTSVANWNVNQIYLFVVASYETSKNQKNEVVIYDRILRASDDYIFNLKNVKTKYPLRDEHKGSLANRKISLTVKYQIMPIFGLLQVSELSNKASFEIPSEYASVESKKKTTKK
jgi:signal peptidase complex subunit 3